MTDAIIKSVLEKLDELKAENIKIINLEKRNLLFSAWIKSSNSREIEGLSGTIKNEDFGVITISKKYE